MQEKYDPRDLAAYIESPDVRTEGQEPPHVPSVPFDTADAAESAFHPGATLEERWAESDYFASLDGEWRFRWDPTPAAAPAIDAVDGWDRIPVPSSWQARGFGNAVYRNVALDWTGMAAVETEPDPPAVPSTYNPVGTYRRSFEVPDEWTRSRRVRLHFEGVKSAFFCWINGSYVGYGQGSMTPAEFDVTEHVSTDQSNSITVRVFRFSDGTYLESQDMLRMSGIHRSVYLYSTPEIHLRDYTVTTQFDDDYRDATLCIEGEVENGTTQEMTRTICATLRDVDTGDMLDVGSRPVSVSPGESEAVSIEREVEHPRQWSAESPDLYTLLLEVRDDQAVTEVLHERVGFREVEIVDGQVCVNGRPITVRGVNRHEHDPELGRTVPPERLHQDLRRMKELNVNAIRTSHYPSDPSFYALASEYGFYVLDEVNVETHYDQELVNDRPEFHDAYLDRFVRMVERDKNFPCVVGWSTGNEAGTGPAHYDMAEYATREDGTRFLVHQGPGEAPYDELPEVETGTAPFADIAGLRYPSIEDLEAVLAGEEERPIVMGEYNHAPGNSLGLTNAYWELIDEHDQLQGGFVWEWVNQSLTRGTTTDDGDPITYQWSDESVEALDGVVFSDRRLTPQAHELAHSQAPITVDVVEFAPGTTRLRVHNKHSFTDLSAFEATWRLEHEGEVLDAGSIEPEGPPQTATELSIPAGTAHVPGDESHLTVEFERIDGVAWRDGPFVVAAEQFELPVEANHSTSSPSTSDGPSLSVSETPERFRVESDDVVYLFSRYTGELISASLDGFDVLASGPRFDVWRPPTINESTAFTPWCSDQETGWLQLGLDDLSATTASVEILQTDPEAFELAADSFVSGTEADAGFEVSTRYRVTAGGTVVTTVEAEPNEAFREALPGWLPRIGVQFDVPRDLSSFEWYGRGPHESYPDRGESAHVGRYAGSVTDQFSPYCPPQGNGNKCDTRWAALTDDTGRGLLVFGETPASVSLQPYENVHEAMYAHELIERETVGLDLDWRTAGVGGTPVPPLEEYRVYPEATTYTFGFRPVDGDEDPMTAWRASLGTL